MRKHLGPADVVATLRMLRASFSGVWMLVEGEADQRVMDRFVDPATCRVQPCYGKRSVLEVMSVRTRAALGHAVAVVDSDFWWLEDVEAPQDVVTTDGHDLEALLVRSPALEAVLAEHADPERLAAFLTRAGAADLRTLVFERARPLGHLRWLNRRDRLMLRFAGLRLEDYLEPQRLTFDLPKYLLDLHTRSNCPVAVGVVADRLKASLEEDYDPYWLCQGHDIVLLLAYALREGGFTRRQPATYRADLVEKDLRLAFDSRYFRRTDVYTQLVEWEKANDARVLDV